MRATIIISVTTTLAFSSASLSQPTATPTKPSFDCSLAGTPIERTICSDDALARLDAALAAALQKALAQLKGDGRKRLADDQQRWIFERTRNCGSGARETIALCLKESMSSRLEILTKTAE